MRPLISSIIKRELSEFSKKQNIRLISNVQNYLIDTNHNDASEKNFIVKKFTEINKWYSQMTGLDKLEKLQKWVIAKQEKLEKAQEERRKVGSILTEVQKELSELQDQLKNMNKYENTEEFIALSKKQFEILKEEKHLTAKFVILDKTEREYFTALSNAIRYSHEKERMYLEYSRIWKIILSIISVTIGSIITTLITLKFNYQIVHKLSVEIENKFKQIVKSVKADDKPSNSTLGSLFNASKNLSSTVFNILGSTFQGSKKMLHSGYTKIMNLFRKQ